MDDSRFETFKSELKAIIDSHITANKALEESRNEREVVRNQKADQFQGEMRGAMKTLQEKVADHDSRFKAVEADTEAKIGAAIASVGNVEDKVDAAVRLLEGQNLAARLAKEEATKEKEEERKNNSIAVRHKNDSIRAKTPIWLATISFLGLLVTDISSCQRNQASNEATSSQVSRLAARVESIGTLTTKIANEPLVPTYVLPQTEIAVSASSKPAPEGRPASPPHQAAAAPAPAAPANASPQ